MLVSTLATITVAVIIIFLSACNLGIFLAVILEIDDYRQLVILLFFLFMSAWVWYYFYLS